MSDVSIFQVGDDVQAPGGRGNVIEIRELPSGIRVIATVDTNGKVSHALEQAVRSAEGMGGYPNPLRF